MASNYFQRSRRNETTYSHFMNKARKHTFNTLCVNCCVVEQSTWENSSLQLRTYCFRLVAIQENATSKPAEPIMQEKVRMKTRCSVDVSPPISNVEHNCSRGGLQL